LIFHTHAVIIGTDEVSVITVSFFGRCIILKFYVRVFEAGIAFALILAVVFASFKTQETERSQATEKKNELLFY